MEKKQKMEEKKSEKLSYEQLEQVANNLNSQCQQMYSKLKEAEELIANFNEVGMLLSIIDKGENFSSKFITRCTDKVEEVVNHLLDIADKKDEEASKES